MAIFFIRLCLQYLSNLTIIGEKNFVSSNFDLIIENNYDNLLTSMHMCILKCKTMNYIDYGVM